MSFPLDRWLSIGGTRPPRGAYKDPKRGCGSPEVSEIPITKTKHRNRSDVESDLLFLPQGGESRHMWHICSISVHIDNVWGEV
jgi:hypothetical protein